MDAAFRDFLKQRHGFDTWRESAAVIRQFEFSGRELPEWRITRAERAGDSLDTFWSRSAGEMLRVNVTESASPAAAREALIEWLGEFESPLLARDAAGPGDVAFAMPGGSAVLFTRGNLVVVLRNAGPQVQGLAQLASGLDQALLRRASTG